MKIKALILACMFLFCYSGLAVARDVTVEWRRSTYATSYKIELSSDLGPDMDRGTSLCPYRSLQSAIESFVAWNSKTYQKAYSYWAGLALLMELLQILISNREYFLIIKSHRLQGLVLIEKGDGMHKIWGECNTELKLIADTKEDQLFLWFIEKLVSDRAVIMSYDRERVEHAQKTMHEACERAAKINTKYLILKNKNRPWYKFW